MQQPAQLPVICPGLLFGSRMGRSRTFHVTILIKWPLTPESPLDCKEIHPVHSKGDQSWVFFGGMMLKLKLQYFGHLMQRVDSLEKALMLGRIGGRRKRG